MISDGELMLLRRLAQVYGIQVTYYDVFQHARTASHESLLAMLQVLGVPVASLSDVPAAWREYNHTLWQRLLEPVCVLWQGKPGMVPVRLPLETQSLFLQCLLTLENGETEEWRQRLVEMPIASTAEIEGAQYAARLLPIPSKLAPGYHRLEIQLDGKRQSATLICAPLTCYRGEDEARASAWGVFAPLYALHSARGSADFGELGRLADWVGGMGGGVVATLPFLAGFTEDLFEPSPYRPASRLFWNEFYLDLAQIPELQSCPPAREKLAAVQNRLDALRKETLVDYRAQTRLKRPVLAELCRCFYANGGSRFDGFRQFAGQESAGDYAAFRAALERRHAPWQRWDIRMRDGVIQPGDYDEDARQYHLYVQWLAREQVAQLVKLSGERGLQLYLDLPLGTHPAGYDTWRERQSFLSRASAGAPPDAVFHRGQDWNFPPPHPENIRKDAYRYFRACLEHTMAPAGIVRLDHVMGLHRLFCVPQGLPVQQGVYLRYHADEMYAILALESHRHRTMVVGEDLGTVPVHVTVSVKKHGMARMYVLQYELAKTRYGGSPPPVPRSTIASLNTHDMPTFAAFWQGLDIKERVKFAISSQADAAREMRSRQLVQRRLISFLRNRGWLGETGDDVASVMKACLLFLANNPEDVLLVNLEDLWLETEPQNIPSAGDYPSWQRRLRYSLEDIIRNPDAIAVLSAINRERAAPQVSRV